MGRRMAKPPCAWAGSTSPTHLSSASRVADSDVERIAHISPFESALVVVEFRRGLKQRSVPDRLRNPVVDRCSIEAGQ
jgi:hypothetical protein